MSEKDNQSPSDPNPGGFESIYNDLVTRRDNLRAAMRQEIAAAGSPIAYLQNRFPALVTLRLSGSSDSNSVDLSEEALLAETEVFYESANARVEMCARCPPEGAACSKHQVFGLKRGLKPRWEKDRLVAERCDPWREYAMRVRIMNAGVDARTSGVTMDSVAHAGVTFSENSLEKMETFITSACVSEDAWLVITAKAPVHTKIAVAVLRIILDRNRRIWALYAYVPAMQRKMMQYFRKESETPDPLENLRECELAVIDGLAVKNVPDWYLFEMRDLILDRWRRKANTIISGPGALTDLVGRYVSEIAEVPAVVTE